MEKEQISSGNIIDFKVLRRLLAFVKPYRFRFGLVIFLTVVLGILSPLRPVLIQYTLDHDVAVGDYDAMVFMIMVLIGLLLVQSIA